MIDVSIIIPTYNRKILLQESINSCFTKSNLSIEIIVVDDGSTDGTEEMIASMHIPIQYLTQPHSGGSRARNIGLQNARGKYIKFLDSDDKLSVSALKGQIEALERKHADVCYGQWQYCESNGDVLEEMHGMEHPDLLAALLNDQWSANFAYLYRRSFLEEHHCEWPEYDVLQDLAFCIHVALCKPNSVYQPGITGWYRQHSFDHRTHRANAIMRNTTQQSILQSAKKKLQKELLYRELCETLITVRCSFLHKMLQLT